MTMSDSSQSPPAVQRLSKRSSVDSGICGMESQRISNGGQCAEKQIGRSQQQKLNRFDRSTSLPQQLTNGLAGTEESTDGFLQCNGSNNQIGHISLLSPLRKMDFALCKYNRAHVLKCLTFFTTNHERTTLSH